MNSIFKENIAKSNLEELSKSKDYSQFYRKFTKLDPSKLHSNRSWNKNQQQLGASVTIQTKQLGTQNFIQPVKSQLQTPIEEILESSVEQKQSHLSFYVNPNLFLDLIKPNVQQNTLTTHNFIELTVWAEIVRSINISLDNNGQMLLTMDNYSGIMREYLIKSVVNFSGNKNGLFEVLIRFNEQKSKQDIFSSPQIQIHDNEEVKIDMYVRINFFQKVNSINEKILLRQILFSYYNENRLKFRNIPKEQHPHNLMNLVGFNSNENQSQGNHESNVGGGNYYHHRQSNLQNIPAMGFNQQFDNYSPSPNNNAQQADDQTQYLNFSECTFDHSDLIKVSYLLLDRIRTSIQEKQMQIMKFYGHQNEIFETGRMDDNYEVNEPLPLPPVQLQITQNVASAYLNLNELPQEPISILKKPQTIEKLRNFVASDENINIPSKQQLPISNFSSHTLDQMGNADYQAEMSIVSQLINPQLGTEKKIRGKNECLVDRKARKKIKMNNNININELLDGENRQLYMKTLYRGIFTVRPLQIIAIFFYKKFYVQIYNTINGKNLITDLSFSTVEHQIPYLQHMIKLELYQEIGKRIFLSFKNRLMIKSYPELIDY